MDVLVYRVQMRLCPTALSHVSFLTIGVTIHACNQISSIRSPQPASLMDTFPFSCTRSFTINGRTYPSRQVCGYTTDNQPTLTGSRNHRVGPIQLPTTACTQVSNRLTILETHEDWEKKSVKTSLRRHNQYTQRLLPLPVSLARCKASFFFIPHEGCGNGA